MSNRIGPFQRVGLDDLTPTDYRRAAVLLRGWVDDPPDPAVVEHVFHEVARDGRVSHLIVCILTVTAAAVPDLCTPDTRARLANAALTFAHDEEVPT